MANYPTPHINATPSDFAPSVLMPGDPLRSKFIAENFLSNAKLVNNVRNVQGYTGLYKGVPVSVMASGMGAPSIGIYSYELFNFFGVENIIRVGTAGAISPKLKVRDLVVGMGACTNSAFADQFKLNGTFAPICSFELLRKCVESAKDMGLNITVGNLLTNDNFYNSHPDDTKRWSEMGVLAVEMESAALYMNAAQSGKKALTICTISDHILTGEATTAEERQTSFSTMMELALNTAIK